MKGQPDGTTDDRMGGKPAEELSQASDSGFLDTSPAIFSESYTSISDMKSSSRGFSRLLRAKLHGKWVVLKTLKPQYAADVTLQTLLRKEFEIGYSLNHPNIAQTIDFVSIPGYGNCIVMEWVDGQSLKQLIHDRKLDASQAISLLKDIVRALDYVHQHQIVHRDVKPSNIMVASIGNVPKIIDFGLSDGSAFNILKQPAGTPRYMSPEARDPGNFDERIDMYSVGVIAEELSLSLPHGNGVLQRVARQCTNADVEQRPRNFREIHWQSRLRIKPIAALMAIAALVIGLAVWWGVSGESSKLEGRTANTATEKAEKVETEELAENAENGVNSGLPAADTVVIRERETQIPPAENEKSLAALLPGKMAPDYSAKRDSAINATKQRIERTRNAQDQIRSAIMQIGVDELSRTYGRARQLRNSKGEALTWDDISPMMDDNYRRVEQEARKYYNENPEIFARAGYDWAKTSLILEDVKVYARPAPNDDWQFLFK